MKKDNNAPNAKISFIDPPQSHKIRGINIHDVTHVSRESEALIKRIAALVTAIKDGNCNLALDLQIRDGYINVYYRGGCLWKISNLSAEKPNFRFDSKYCLKNEQRLKLPKVTEADAWLNSREMLQSIMDQWFTLHPKEEREIQQDLCAKHLQEKASDWVVLDIEYAAWLHRKKINKGEKGRRLCRFDFIALRRKSPEDIYLIELKISSGACKGRSSGVISHAEDFAQFLWNTKDVKALKSFKDSMRNILREKAALGLLPGINAEKILSEENWPKKIHPMFSLGMGASETLSSDGGKSFIRIKAEELLSSLNPREISIWTDLNFNPIAVDHA